MRIANRPGCRHHLYRYQRLGNGAGSIRTMMTAALDFPSPAVRTSSMPSQKHDPVSAEQSMNSDDIWKLVADRDPRADGHIFYAVRTTGIFCRPSCSSRRPIRENVEF